MHPTLEPFARFCIKTPLRRALTFLLGLALLCCGLTGWPLE
jgi:hypothetical protein